MNTSPNKTNPKKKTGKSRRAAARRQKAAAAHVSSSLVPDEDEPTDVKKLRTERDDLVRAVGEAVNHTQSSPVKNGGQNGHGSNDDSEEVDNPNHTSNGNAVHNEDIPQNSGVDACEDQPSPAVLAPPLTALVDEVTSTAATILPNVSSAKEVDSPSPSMLAPPLSELVEEASDAAGKVLRSASEHIPEERPTESSPEDVCIMAPPLSALVEEAVDDMSTAAIDVSAQLSSNDMIPSAVEEAAEAVGQAAEAAAEEITAPARYPADTLTEHAEAEAAASLQPLAAEIDQHPQNNEIHAITDEHAYFLHQVELKQNPHPYAVHGLVVNCAWPWCSTSSAAERQLLALTAAIKNVDNTAYPSIYCYPPSAMHVTLATLSSFVDAESTFARMSSAAKAQTMQQWKEALRSELRRRAVRPFSMLVSRLQVTDSAIIFRIEDATATVPVIRSVIHDISKDKTCDLSPDNVRVPGIIHSTVARFMRPLSPELQRKLQKICDELWTPVTIEVTSVSVVYENAPYMHMTSCGECYSQSQLEQQGKILTIPLSVVAPNRQPSPALMPSPPPTPTAGTAPAAFTANTTNASSSRASPSSSSTSSSTSAVTKPSSPSSSSWILPTVLVSATVVGIGMLVMMRVKSFRK